MNLSLLKVAQLSQICSNEELRAQAFVIADKVIHPKQQMANYSSAEIFVFVPSQSYKITIRTMEKPMDVQCAIETPIATLTEVLAAQLMFAKAVKVVGICDEKELNENSLVISAYQFNPSRVLHFYAVRNYEIRDTDGRFTASVPILESYRVDRAQGVIAAALQKSVCILVNKKEASLDLRLHAIAPTHSLSVRLQFPPFQFVLPNGKIELRRLDALRHFQSLVMDFQDIPNVRFLNSTSEIDPSTQLHTVLGTGAIFVCIAHTFIYHYWDAPRIKAYRPSTKLAEIAADLTGKSAREFVITQGHRTFSGEESISTVPFLENQPVVLTRMFPLRFEFESKKEPFEKTFDALCTFGQLKDFVQSSYPNFDVSPLLNIPDHVEIYSILASTERILIREASRQFQNDNIHQFRPRHSLPTFDFDSSINFNSAILPGRPAITPGLSLRGSTHSCTFRYADTGECRTLEIPDTSTVADVSRIISRDRRHPGVLFFNGESLPDSLVFSSAVPLGSEVRVEFHQLRYTVRHEQTSVEIPLDDSATAVDLKAPVILALFPDRAISQDSLSFVLLRGNLEFRIKTAKEAITQLMDFHAPNLVIVARLRNPPYYFQPPDAHSKPKKIRFPDSATIDSVYEHWEKQLKRPVLLRAGSFMIPRAATALSSLGLSGQTIIVEFAAELESATGRVRLPGRSPQTLRLKPGDTARTLLSQLTYDNPERTFGVVQSWGRKSEYRAAPTRGAGARRRVRTPALDARRRATRGHSAQ